MEGLAFATAPGLIRQCCERGWRAGFTGCDPLFVFRIMRQMRGSKSVEVNKCCKGIVVKVRKVLIDIAGEN